MRVPACFFLFWCCAALAGCSFTQNAGSPAIPLADEQNPAKAAAPVHNDAPKPQAGPLPVRYGSVPTARYLRTACRSNNQSTYIRHVVETTVDNNALSILFPMNPAFHLVVAIEVKDGHYSLSLRRVPLRGGYRIEHEVERVSLILDKQHYAAGDVLHGHLELHFSESVFRQGSPKASPDKADTKLDTSAYYFTGPFSAIVRPAGFDPQADESIATYTDLAMAMQALPHGAYASELRFSPGGRYTETPLQEVEYWQEHLDISGPLFVKSELSLPDNYSPDPALDAKRKQLFAEQNTPKPVVWEVSWSIGPESFYGTNGTERLTMWFVRSGDRWQRIGYAKLPLPPYPES